MLDYKDFLISLEDLKALRVKKRAIEAELKDINSDIDKLVFDLVEHMENSDLEQVKISGLGTCFLTRTKKYSIDDPSAFEEWMRENGEMENVMAVHASKVHGFYKERLENNEDLPPGVRTFIKNNVTIRS